MRDALATAALFLALLALMAAPLPLGFADHVTAWSHGEADNHLWMQWIAAHPGTAWANAPAGTGLPLMDPVNLPWFALGFSWSPAAAWNLAWVASLALALAGGLALGREAGGTLEGGWVGMAVLGTAPFLAGMGAFGLTEAWPLGWWALALTALLRWGRTGRWGWVLAAGGCLGAFGLSGGYHALLAAVGTPLALAWAARRDGWERRRWLGAGAALLLGVVVTLPLAADLWAARDLWAHRWGGTALPVSADPGWATHPVGGGADLLRALWPSWGGVPSGRSLYLGWGVLALAALGTRPRTGWLAAGALALWLLSLGVRISVAGHPVVPGPASLMAALPGGGALTHWYRATGPLVVLLAALAALGGARVVARASRPRWAALGLAALVAVEGALLGGVPWPRPSYDPRPPSELAALEGEGALVLLPFDNRRGAFSDAVPRAYDRWGPWLARPLAEHYEGPDALLAVRLVAAADSACGGEPTVPAAWRPAPGLTDPHLPASAVEGGRRALRAAGVDHLVLLPDRALEPDLCAALIEGWLGPPHTRTAAAVAWTP